MQWTSVNETLKQESQWLEARANVRESLEQALVQVWRQWGMSIVKLGRLERIEYHANLAVYEFFREVITR